MLKKQLPGCARFLMLIFCMPWTSQLIELTRPAGFYIQKSKTIQALCAWIKQCDWHAFDTATIRRSLMDIQGIGPESADCILLYAFARPVFVVDAYLKRLWVQAGLAPLSSYEQYQAAAMAQLVPDVAMMQEFHALIVCYGKFHLRKGSQSFADDPLLSIITTQHQS